VEKFYKSVKQPFSGGAKSKRKDRAGKLKNKGHSTDQMRKGENQKKPPKGSSLFFWNGAGIAGRINIKIETDEVMQRAPENERRSPKRKKKGENVQSPGKTFPSLKTRCGFRRESYSRKDSSSMKFRKKLRLRRGDSEPLNPSVEIEIYLRKWTKTLKNFTQNGRTCGKEI